MSLGWKLVLHITLGEGWPHRNAWNMVTGSESIQVRIHCNFKYAHQFSAAPSQRHKGKHILPLIHDVPQKCTAMGLPKVPVSSSRRTPYFRFQCRAIKYQCFAELSGNNEGTKRLNPFLTLQDTMRHIRSGFTDTTQHHTCSLPVSMCKGTISAYK